MSALAILILWIAAVMVLIAVTFIIIIHKSNKGANQAPNKDLNNYQ